MELARYWMWTRTKLSRSLIVGSSLGESSWEEKAFAEDLGGCTWPPRSYSCTFCRRDFRSAQALGGHMNVHRRDRARLKQSPGVGEQVNIQGQQLTQAPQIGTTQFVFGGDASENPNPNSGIQASPPRSTGEEELLLPSTRRSLEEVVPLRPFIVPQVKIGEETWEPKKEFGLPRWRDCDDVMVNRNKRRRTDDFFIADQQVLEAEVLHRFNPVEKLDLELRLGRL